MAVVARCLGVDRSSIYRWRQAAASGPAGLAAQPHPHRPPTLTDAQLGRLETLLAQGTQAHGWPNHLWTAARVGELIHRTFGIRYHHDHVGRFLRRRLGWTPQKAFVDGLRETVEWYRDNRAWWEPIKSGDYRAYYERQYADRLANATSV